MSQSSNSTNFQLTIPPQGNWNIQVKASASTHYCMQCDNKGYESYMKDGGVREFSRCPDCVNRERGIPIPWSELNA